MNLKAAIEAILFVQGEPLAISRLAKAVGAKKSEVETALQGLEAEYRERGMNLLHYGDEWQFVTNPREKEVVQRFVSAEFSGELSKSAIEVLTIIAYKCPISRARIEYIRGVDSSFSLRNLLMRGLVRREENPEDRRSYLYHVSNAFLKYLGLSKMSGLPEYDALRRKEIEFPSAQKNDTSHET